MTAVLTPERWAYDLTKLLNAAFPGDRFPVDLPLVARNYSTQKWPDDPIISIKGDNLPKFDGALFRAPTGKKGWGIIYNNAISSQGRVNFTLAHEFGHYLLHRHAYPDGFYCSQQQVAWDSELGQVEHQANVFAANLLMPLDDFRREIPGRTKVDLDMIAHCADRYRVSLIAATLRWLSYTSKRAILVVSRDGYILWSRASESALRTRAFFRTSNGPIEIPASSLAARQDMLLDNRIGVDHGPRVWLDEPVREMAIFSEQYDFAISLLLLDDSRPFSPAFTDQTGEQDTYDRMVAGPRVR